MSRHQPFEANAGRYDTWFDNHQAAYLSELLAVRALLPIDGTGLEIGVGSGRFAAPLAIQFGIDPSPAMLHMAAARGIRTLVAVAENLPFAANSFDQVLLVTTLCFLDTPATMLAEAHRVLKPGGTLVIGFIDRSSPLGQKYLEQKTGNVFYREATLYSAAEVEHMLAAAGFAIRNWVQTITRAPNDLNQIEALRPGHGDGLFVVVAADKSRSMP